MSKKKKPPRLRFQSTNLSTGFGTSSYDPRSGQVKGTLDPRLAAQRDEFYDAGEAALEGADWYAQLGDDYLEYGAGLFDQASGYDVGEARDAYYSDMLGSLDMSRDQRKSQLNDGLFRTGRLGAGVGVEGGGYINPEQFAESMAINQQNQQLWMQSEDRALSQQDRLFANAQRAQGQGSALGMIPYEQAAQSIGYGTGLEGLNQQNLQTLGQFSQLQQGWQSAEQQANAARAAASGGGFGSSLLGSVANAGLNYMSGGGWAALGSSAAGLFSGGGVIGGGGGASGVGGMFGYGSGADSMFGYAPPNFGGGTIGPQW